MFYDCRKIREGIELRGAVSLTLAILGLITGVSGIFLLLAPLLSFDTIMPLMSKIHRYISFAFFGVSVVHLALNWPLFKKYLKL